MSKSLRRSRVTRLVAALAGTASLLISSTALAATLTVNSTGDGTDAGPGDGFCFTGVFVQVAPGFFGPECTLRAAIQEANALAGADSIAFAASLPKAAGVVEIFPQSGLPWIDSEILIDGYTADGYDVLDPDEAPVVNIGGSQAGAGARGLVVDQGGSGSVLRGLAVFAFDGSGILLTSLAPQALTDVRIEGCHVGIWRGVFYQGNGGDGIEVRSARRTRIGTACDLGGCSGRRNVIADNAGHGIDLSSATFSIVGGNRIGTNTSGTATFVPFGGNTPNGEWGIRIQFGGRNTVGGRPQEAHNLISGNLAGGIQVDDSAGNSILGNSIGTNLAGTQALANDGSGVELLAGFNFVGGASVGQGNLISGNTSAGIDSEGPNVIVGNTIGLDLAQATSLPNDWDGILLSGSGARVEDNVIGGNGRHGLLAFGDSHRVVSNLIGTNALGTNLRNGLNGIVVSSAHSVQVGDAGMGNVIGFNNLGIGVSFAAGPNQVQGNFIGTDPNGNPIPNESAGIYISVSDDQMIGGQGGLTNGLGNVIGHNLGRGIGLESSGPLGSGNFVIGNYIGTNANDEPLGNDGPGVRIHGTGNAVGADLGTPLDSIVAHANRIAHNEGPAVRLNGLAIGNAIRGNQLFANGADAPIDLGDEGDTPNDVGDVDTGTNRLQNFPEFVLGQTQWNEMTGDLEVRYRVNANEGDASYPLQVDFYLRTQLDSEAEIYVGSDVYPVASATLYRSVAITPQPDVLVEGILVATATDADGNTSELSTQLVPVPEPGGGVLLAAGVSVLGCAAAFRHAAGRR